MADYEARLGIVVESRDVDRASQSLNELQRSARQTETATERFMRKTEEAARQAAQLSAQAAAANRSLANMSRNASNLGSSLGDAAKKVAGLVAAYAGLNKVAGLVSDGFAYNEQLETARLGIASVISATLDLRDAQGKAIEGQEKFTAAQEMSVQMAKALDVASMQSPAAYTDLLTTFQRLLAPASQLGLQWKDTLDVTINMSNVLSSLGLDMERLGAETESILTGKNISKSQVAMRLGITKEEIESWGVGAKLIENFQKRFESFKYAGVAVESTMTAVREYYNDVVANIAGEASNNLWLRLKESMLTVADAFYEINEQTNQFEIREEIQPLVDMFNAMGDSIGGGVVNSVKSVMSTVDKLGKYIGKVGVDDFLDNMARNAKVAAAAIAALIVARRQLQQTASVQMADGSTQQYSGYIGMIKAKLVAQQQEAVMLERIARQELIAADAALVRFRANNQEVLSTKKANETDQIRIAILREEKALEEQLARAQRSHVASQDALSLAGKIDPNSRKQLFDQGKKDIFSSMKNSAAGLVGFLGGPWGIAMTAATTGIALLATHESDAEKATKLHTKAQEAYAKVMENVKDKTAEAMTKLSEYDRKMLEVSQRNANSALEKGVNAFFSKVQTKSDRIEAGDWWSGLADFPSDATSKLDEYVRKYEELRSKFNQGSNTDVPALLNALTDLHNQMKAAGLENTDMAKSLEEMLVSANNGEGGLKQLGATAAEIKKIMDALAGSVENAAVAAGGLANIKGLGELAADMKFDADVSKLSKQQQGLAKQFAKLGGVSNEQALKFAKGDYSGATDSDKELLQQIAASNSIVFNSKSSGGGGAASKIENASEKIRKLKEEIDQLNGVASKSGTKFDDKMVEIQKMGEAAKMSQVQIDALKEEYGKAFQSNALKDFNKELLSVQGNTRELRDIEIADKVKQWEQTFEAAGIKAEEYAPHIAKYKEALNKQSNIKDLQTAVNFMNEMKNLGAEFGETTILQNQLIEQQAQLYATQLGPEFEQHVERWKQLQLLIASNKPWDGAVRGMMKFGAEYGNLANQIEQFTTQMGNTIASTLSNAFMKGKLSVEDFFSSLVSMAAQAASNYFIGMLFQGIGGLFSGGGVPNATNSAAQANGFSSANPMMDFHAGMWATGGVISGGNLSNYRNSVVTSPTVFSGGHALPAYANGAGLMGEAGPEAIMPLTRMANGNLGVQADFGGYYGNRGQVSYGNQQPDFSPNITINVVNNTNGEAEADAEMKPDGQGGFTLEVMINQIEQGMVQRAKSGRSPLVGYMEKSFGLSRAGALVRNRR